MQPPAARATRLPFDDFGALLTLKRTLLFAARDDTMIQERIDAAELALALGFADAARGLYDLLAVRTGFSASGRTWQAAVAARTGLWPASTMSGGGGGNPGGFAIDVAVTELRRLMAASGTSASDPVWPVLAEALVEGVAPSVTAGQERRARPVPGEIFAACARLRSLLAQPADRAALVELAVLLNRLRLTFADGPAADLREDVSDPERLIATLIAADLQRFLATNETLAFAPFGSAAILHAAAQLEPAALGPYFTNVGRIIRDCRDIPGLVRLAAGSGGQEEPSGRWTVLLCTHVGMSTLLDLVDELGDRDVMQPLWAILYVVVRDLRRHRDRGPLWRIRDAALDNRDYRLAAATQRAIALWADDDPVEWRILGEIHVMLGGLRDARRAFLQGLRRSRGDGDLRRSLRLLRTGMFDPMPLTGGFGTPDHRRRRRLARHPLPVRDTVAPPP